MTSPTLARDAAGNAMLTTEQARDIAEFWVSPDEVDVMWAEDDSGDDLPLVTHEGAALEALARWVLRWAPVVEAAEGQTDAVDRLPEPEPDALESAEGSLSGHWWLDTLATEAAVRAARAAGGEVPA